MLHLTLVIRDGLDAQARVYGGTIGRLHSQTGLATYRCEFEDAQRSKLDAVTLENYPRWAEPVALLVARAIERVLTCAHQLPQPHPVQAPRCAGSLGIELNAFHLHRVNWRMRDAAMSVAGHCAALAAPMSPWALAQAALCLQSTGSLVLPALPEPLRPPVYEYEGIAYCRLRDLPLDTRRAYSQLRAGSTYPEIPGSPDARYAWDVQQFINGGH